MNFLSVKLVLNNDVKLFLLTAATLTATERHPHKNFKNLKTFTIIKKKTGLIVHNALLSVLIHFFHFVCSFSWANQSPVYWTAIKPLSVLHFFFSFNWEHWTVILLHGHNAVVKHSPAGQWWSLNSNISFTPQDFTLTSSISCLLIYVCDVLDTALQLVLVYNWKITRRWQNYRDQIQSH